MDMSWMQNPKLKNIHPKKLEILKELATNSRGKTMNEALPILMRANQRLKESNMSFTKDETDVFLEILTSDMSPQEKAKVDLMKNVIKNNMKK